MLLPVRDDLFIATESVWTGSIVLVSFVPPEYTWRIAFLSGFDVNKINVSLHVYKLLVSWF